MAKIVINIPDFLYKQILKKHVSKALIARMFQNGVVLPKGHSDLIDRGKLKERVKGWFSPNEDGAGCEMITKDDALISFMMEIEEQEPVIEADKEW